MRRQVGIRLNADGLVPLVAFDGVANGYCCCGIASFEIGHAEALHRADLIENAARLIVTAELKVGVDEIVHGVKLFTNVVLILCCLGGRKIGGDGVLPEAGAGEDVGGHVKGVRRGGSDLSVLARRC